MTFGTDISHFEVAKMKRQIVWSLWLRGRPPLEGSASTEELVYLALTARRTNARLICEIGFNAGFSAQAFLSAHPDNRVISFDLVEHGYTKIAKRLVDARFPGRHTLIPGDSTKTIPEFKQQNPSIAFDLAFIDGGHEYEVARADIDNLLPLCHSKTTLIIDDLTPWYRWGKGPTKAWSEAIRDGVIQQDELFNDGKAVEKIEPPGKRVWASGALPDGSKSALRSWCNTLSVNSVRTILRSAAARRGQDGSKSRRGDQGVRRAVASGHHKPCSRRKPRCLMRTWN